MKTTNSLLKIIVALLMTIFCSKVYSNVYTVTSTSNGTTTDGVSLRWAITQANSHSGADTINFNLGGASSYTITLTSALPALTDNAGVTIDGWENGTNDGTPNTVPVFNASTSTPMNAVYRVVLKSTTVNQGILINSDNNIIKGLVFEHFTSGSSFWTNIAIYIPSGNNNQILGCYIGMQINGTTRGGATMFSGIRIATNNNIVGDGTAAGTNLISGNNHSGVYINGTNNYGNKVQGNIIGLQKDGSSIVTSSSQDVGVEITGTGYNNIIGGTTAGQGNVISGNTNRGIGLNSSHTTGNQVYGNIIGAQADGLTNVSSHAQDRGIYISDSPNNVIGGTTSTQRNIISSNNTYGVFYQGSTTAGNQLKGNYIGINKNGTGVITNNTQDFGIGTTGTSLGNNTIGGTNTNEGNVLSGNTSSGIWLAVSSGQFTIVGNIIGLQADGASYLTNNQQQNGIYISSSNHTVGGTTAGARNIISGNEWYGINIYQSGSNNNNIYGNYIGTTNSLAQVTGSSQDYGVYIFGGANNKIGGTTTGQGNTIAYNTTNGINISLTSSTGNAIRRNLIYSNTGKGIELNYGTNQGNAGKTTPVITNITASLVSGTASAGDAIEVFKNNNSNCIDATTYLGTATANGSGVWSLSGSFNSSDNLIATTTSSGTNNTSEFSFPTLIFSSASPKICLGDSTTITASGFVSYSWAPSTGLSATNIPNPIAFPSVTTTYTVTGTNSNGCNGTASVTVTVSKPYADAGADYAMAVGDTVIIGGNPTASNGINPYTYSWSPSTALNSSTIANPKASPSVPTTYVVTIADSIGCSSQDSVIVYPIISPPAIPQSNFLYYPNYGQLINTANQAIPDVKFYTNNSTPAFYIKNNNFSFVFAKVDTVVATTDTLQRIDVTFLQANSNAKVYPRGEDTTSYLNYFLAHCPNGITNVYGNIGLVTPNLYPNIDLMYYSNTNGITYYFAVKPGGNPADILTKFTGASSINLDGMTNELTINSDIGSIVFNRPLALEIDTSTNAVMPVSIDWVSQGANTFDFNIATYDTTKILLIEVSRTSNNTSASSTCDWITYNGGLGNDIGQDIVTDANGNVFVTGQTYSQPFPNISGGLYSSLSSTEFDAFIIKFNNMGASVWGTYYGGGANTIAYGIRLNSIGDVYITGQTAGANLPLVPSGSGTLQSYNDGFIAKFNSTGNGLLFSKYIGGNDLDYPRGIAIDNNDNVYIAGLTVSSSNFPIVSKTGAYNQNSTTAGPGYPDGFILEFDISNSQIWGTYFGGDGPDAFSSIEIGASNHIILSGSTLSLTPATSFAGNTLCGVPGSPNYFPDCNGGAGTFNNSYGGTGIDNDAIIVEFDNTGALVWSTYFGGEGNEQADDIFKNSIAVNPTNKNIIYLVGTTTKQVNFPTFATGSAYVQTTSFSAAKSYIAKFNSRQKEWITTFGPTGTWGWDAVVDNSSNLYLLGHTNGSTYASNTCAAPSNQNTQFPKCFPSGVFNQPSYGGSASGDGYIAAFNSSNNLIWSTYFGGNQLDEVHACAYDGVNERLYFTGVTQSYSGFPIADPTTGNYIQNSLSGPGYRDTYIARLCISPIITISVDEVVGEDNGINIFPNPTNSILNINLSSEINGIAKIELYDILGNIVLKRNENANKSTNFYKLDMDSFAKGVYLLKISIHDKYYSAKVVIQ